MLRLNMHRFPNATVVRGEVWNKEAQLVFFRDANRTQGTQVQESSSSKKGDPQPKNVVATSNGISIPYLLRLFNLDHFDFMKIDNEGSEEEVFSKSTENDLKYLEKVKVAVIKMYEREKGGAQRSVRRAFNSGFVDSNSGEYAVFVHKE